MVQLEHELADFETVKMTRLDGMIKGMLGERVDRTALLVVCHPEVAHETLEIDQRLGGMLPCTTVVYEREGEDCVHVHHFSQTKAIRDLGCAPEDSEADVDDLVELTGERMTDVWENIKAHAEMAESDADGSESAESGA